MGSSVGSTKGQLGDWLVYVHYTSMSSRLSMQHGNDCQKYRIGIMAMDVNQCDLDPKVPPHLQLDGLQMLCKVYLSNPILESKWPSFWSK